MSLKQDADALLRRATDAGDVPGVVAVATDGNEAIYEGAFGKRVPLFMDFQKTVYQSMG